MIMTDVLIITTRNLPEIPIGNVESFFTIIDSTSATSYLTEQNIDINSYLTEYDEGKGVKQDVQQNLREFCLQPDQIRSPKLPVLKRTVNDSFLIYVTLCLDRTRSGYADQECHNFLKAIIADVEDDLKNAKKNSDYHFFILAHSMDLVADNGSNTLSRWVNKNEIKGFTEKIFSKIYSIHIYTHEQADNYYKNIVNVIANPDIDNNILNGLKQ